MNHLFKFNGPTGTFEGIVVATSFVEAMEKVIGKLSSLGYDAFLPVNIVPMNSDIIIRVE